MIYFFDNELNMVKVTTSKNVISAVHEHELNGLILGTVETDLSYTEEFINDVDYFGYYYKDNYYLHKIKRVEHEHENELVRITGRHIFFEDMLYGDYIRDVRPENRDALYILNLTVSANTRWQTVMTDTSKVHTTNYYWVPPMEVLNDLTENVGIEYEPRILFDGQKINGFQLHVANRIGEDTPIRVPFGSRVVSLKHEVDYSEILTALYGHGKGEEVGDGYGRRINFSSVNFSRNGVVSPSGQSYMENPEITAQYGKDDGSPKFGRIVFEDIEDEQELAEATYEAYLEQSRPKMLFEASVVDLGDVGMGDGVLIIRREYDVYFNARIHKLVVGLLDAENADVELGDYAHFKESKVQRKTRESNNQYRRETSSRIQQLKEQFNERFDGEVNQMREDFEQALIDAHADIEASEQRMTELIGDERASLQEEIDVNINDAREYADTQIADKEAQYEADWNQRDADIQQTIKTVVGGSVDALDTNLLDVNSRLFQTRNDLIERINNIDTQSFNLIRGSRFDEPDRYATSGGTVHDDEDMPYFRYGISSENIQYISTVDDIQFEAGKTYTLSLDYRTSSNVPIDYLRIIATDGSTDINIRNHIGDSDMAGITPDGEWHRTFLTFTVPRNLTGNLRIGSDFTSGTKAQIDIRLPYLTTSGNTQWVFHPSDSYESIMSIMTRLDEFEARVENDLAGVSGELSSAREALQQQLDDARSELEGLEYENRNYFKPSTEITIEEGDEEGDSSSISYPDDRIYGFNLNGRRDVPENRIRLNHVITSNGWWTISFDVSSNSGNWFFVGVEGEETGQIYISQEEERMDFSFYISDYKVGHYVDLFTSSWAFFYFNKIKIEKGKVATTFSIAPEDTEAKITTLNEQIEYIDGQLSVKLEQTDIEPINNKITEYGTTLDANAESIGLLQEKTELHDGDITKWSNLTESNAEEIGRTLTRISEIDGNIERVETDIYVNAESISGLLTRTSEAEQSIADVNLNVDGIIADFANYKKDIDSDVGNLSAQVASYEASVDSFRAEIGTLQGDINDVDNWIADKGAVIDGTAEAISARVWQTDIDAVEVGGRNLVENSSFKTGDLTHWDLSSSIRGTIVESDEDFQSDYAVLLDGDGGSVELSPSRGFDAGKYIVTIWYKHLEGDTLYLYGGSGYDDYIFEEGDGETLQKVIFKMTVENNGDRMPRIRYASGFPADHTNGKTIVYAVKIEKGNKATDWTPAPEDSLMKTDFELRADGFFLGGNYVGGDHYSTAIVGDADGLKLLGDNIDVSGNLNVKGDVEAWAVSAVEGEFGRLWAAEFSATTITGDHIDGDTITGRHLSVDSAMVDKLIADTAFANDIQTLSLSAVRGDIADLRSRILTANVITTDHIRWSNALFNRLTGDEAFIDRLEVKAANIRDLTGTHIRGGLLDSLNGAARLNLNTGDWTLGGSASIEFTDPRNAMYFSRGVQFSGLGFDVGSSGRPISYLGTSTNNLNTNDQYWTGLIVTTNTSMWQDGSYSSITGRRLVVRRMRLEDTGFIFDMTGSRNQIRPWGPVTSVNYDLGSGTNYFDRVYAQELRINSERLIIRSSHNTDRGYYFDTQYRAGGASWMHFGGLNSGSYWVNPYYYALGNSNGPFQRAFINAVTEGSDERIKEDISDNPLGLDFINDIKTRVYTLIDTKDRKNGVVAQEMLEVLEKHNVPTDRQSIVSLDDILGVEYTQLIAPTIRAVQEVDAKVETNITTLASHESRIETTEEKIKRLEKEIQQLKGA